MTDESRPEAGDPAEWDEAEKQWEAQQSSRGGFTGGIADTMEAAGGAVVDGVQGVIDVFRPEHVQAEAPDLSDIPMTPEEVTTHSSSVSRDDAPPPADAP
jgi:hypothetical protein